MSRPAPNPRSQIRDKSLSRLSPRRPEALRQAHPATRPERPVRRRVQPQSVAERPARFVPAHTYRRYRNPCQHPAAGRGRPGPAGLVRSRPFEKAAGAAGSVASLTPVCPSPLKREGKKQGKTGCYIHYPSRSSGGSAGAKRQRGGCRSARRTGRVPQEVPAARDRSAENISGMRYNFLTLSILFPICAVATARRAPAAGRQRPIRPVLRDGAGAVSRTPVSKDATPVRHSGRASLDRHSDRAKRAEESRLDPDDRNPSPATRFLRSAPD